MTRHAILSVACLAVLATRQGALAYDWWMNQPYGDQSFNQVVEYTHNNTLECNDSRLEPGYTFQYWLRPDLTVMLSGDAEWFDTLDGTAGWQVNDTTYSMHVFILQEAHFGFYHCVLNNSAGDIFVIKKAINYEEPYYGDPWERYKKSTIIGGAAAGGFLVLAIVLLLLCRFHYNTDDSEASYSLKDFDIEDPMEGGSGSRSGSVSVAGEKVAPPVDGPQIHVNPEFDARDVVVATAAVASFKAPENPELKRRAVSDVSVKKADSPIVNPRKISDVSLKNDGRQSYVNPGFDARDEAVATAAAASLKAPESPELKRRSVSDVSVKKADSPIVNPRKISDVSLKNAEIPLVKSRTTTDASEKNSPDRPVLGSRPPSEVEVAMDTIEKAVGDIEKAVDVIETQTPPPRKASQGSGDHGSDSVSRRSSVRSGRSSVSAASGHSRGEQTSF